MGLSSAWRKIKNVTKKASGFSNWNQAQKAFLSPEALLTGGGWATWEATPAAVQGLSSLVGLEGMTNPKFDFPDPTAEPELVGTQQTDSDGGGNLNRRRRGNSYATAGGALGDSTYATSGIRSKLG